MACPHDRDGKRAGGLRWEARAGRTFAAHAPGGRPRPPRKRAPAGNASEPSRGQGQRAVRDGRPASLLKAIDADPPPARSHRIGIGDGGGGALNCPCRENHGGQRIVARTGRDEPGRRGALCPCVSDLAGRRAARLRPLHPRRGFRPSSSPSPAESAHKSPSLSESAHKMRAPFRVGFPLAIGSAAIVQKNRPKMDTKPRSGTKRWGLEALRRSLSAKGQVAIFGHASEEAFSCQNAVSWPK